MCLCTALVMCLHSGLSVGFSWSRKALSFLCLEEKFCNFSAFLAISERGWPYCNLMYVILHNFLCLYNSHVLYDPAVVWMTRLFRAIHPDVDRLWGYMFRVYPLPAQFRLTSCSMCL
jgi:hypothetical protein